MMRLFLHKRLIDFNITSILKRTTIVILAALLFVSISTIKVNAQDNYYEQPVLSVLGDSISTYYGYEDDAYYGPQGTDAQYIIDESGMWWAIYANDNNYKVGWDESVGGGCIAGDTFGIPDTAYTSMVRIKNLSYNGEPDIIAIYGGMNDAWIVNSSYNEFYSNYKILIKRISKQYPNSTIILLTPFLYAAKGAEEMNSRIQMYIDAIHKVANQYGLYCVDTDDVLSFDDFEHVGYHPNETGMQRIADALTEETKNLINIRATLDYDQYHMKINAPGTNNYRFKLTDKSNRKTVYETNWQDNNCFVISDLCGSYVAHAEIDNNNDGIVDNETDTVFDNLPAVRVGGSVYNGVDYSAVYNFNYYIENNKDLYDVFRNEPDKAIEHFVNFGMNEGRQGNETFNVEGYRNRYLDLRRAFGSDITKYYYHYINNGEKEGRDGSYISKITQHETFFGGTDFSPIYDYEYYIEHNPDVKNAYGGDDISTFSHFISCGAYEGRRACQNFDLWTYIINNADLRQAYGWNLFQYMLHYIYYGQFEGRIH